MSDNGSSNSDQQTQASDIIQQLRELLETARSEIASMKGAVEEIQRTTTADANTITNTKQDIERLKNEAQNVSESLDGDYKRIRSDIEQLISERAALEGVLSEIQKLKDDSETKSESVAEAIKSINDAKNGFETLREKTQLAHDELDTKRAAVNTQISDIEKANAAVKQIHGALLVDGEGKTSIKTSINDLKAKITTVLDEATEYQETSKKDLQALKDNNAKEKADIFLKTRKDFSDLRESLNQQILNLLPSAGAAGLSSTYYDAKSRYGVTQFHSNSADPSHKGTFFQRAFAHNPSSVIATGFFYLMFLAPITVIIVLFYDLLEKLATMQLGEVSDRYIAVRALIALPLGTVSLFGYTSLRLYRRLYEEYNYKQRVMELYTSFSKEIEDKGDDEQRKALIAIMLKAVADKPSVGMHRYDGVGSGIKFDVNDMLGKLLGKKKELPANTEQ